MFLFQNKHVDKINEPNYVINLKVEDGHQGTKDVQFNCSLEQLQVWKNSTCIAISVVCFQLSCRHFQHRIQGRIQDFDIEGA